jgi:predicted Zn-dependent protease
MRRGLALGLLAAAFACGSGAPGPGPARDADNYLRWVAVRMPVGGESLLLRWPDGSMPLKVHLPRPPDGLFEDPEAIHDSVRDGILDWTDVAGPGIPRFVFVDDKGAADIPIVWAAQPDGAWYIAFCAYEPNLTGRRLDVSHILVTARWQDGRVADVHDVHRVLLHEMGHALGLTGHSPLDTDIMGGPPREGVDSLSQRDRNTLKALYARPIGTRIIGAKRDRKN